MLKDYLVNDVIILIIEKEGKLNNNSSTPAISRELLLLVNNEIIVLQLSSNCVIRGPDIHHKRCNISQSVVPL